MEKLCVYEEKDEKIQSFNDEFDRKFVTIQIIDYLNFVSKF
jgi:hypothetical protein